MAPELISMPTIPRIRPNTTITNDLRGDPPPMVQAATSPSTMTAKYSVELNRRAISAIAGANAITTRMDKVLPQKEATALMNRAKPALPDCANGYPSSAVTAVDAVPGKFRRMEEMDPPYCAP